METNNRTTETQKVIDTVHAYVREAILDLNIAGRDLEAAKESEVFDIEVQIEAFENYMKALEHYSEVTNFALDIVCALGDGFEEYNAALGRGIEEAD